MHSRHVSYYKHQLSLWSLDDSKLSINLLIIDCQLDNQDWMSTCWELNIDLAWGFGKDLSEYILYHTICRVCWSPESEVNLRDLHKSLFMELKLAKVAAMMMMIVLLLSANMEGVDSEIAPWCYDSCEMGCIHYGPDQSNTSAISCLHQEFFCFLWLHHVFILINCVGVFQFGFIPGAGQSAK